LPLSFPIIRNNSAHTTTTLNATALASRNPRPGALAHRALGPLDPSTRSESLALSNASTNASTSEASLE